MDNELISLKIYSREGVVFNGEVKSVSSYNVNGKFDILPEHANFISLLDKEIKVVEKDGNSRKIDIDAALLRSRGNKIEIYIGIKSFVKPNVHDNVQIN